MSIVILNAGHGGKDPGAVGQGLLEKDRALDYTLAIGKELTRHGVDVKYTRVTDVFIPLTEISAHSNANKADLFVSIHLNAAGNTNAQGFEIYHFPSSSKGKGLATNIHKEVINNKLYTKDRGVKTANFAVLRDTKAPAALIELAFISNLEDVNLLAFKQKEMVAAITKGILKTLNKKYIKKEVVNVKTWEQKAGEKAIDELAANKLLANPEDWKKEDLRNKSTPLWLFFTMINRISRK